MSPIEDMSFAMTNASLNDPGIEFDALSYAWGSTKCTKKIKVNGMRVYVTDNLFDALTLLSRPGTLSRAIWIDAICIDQLNIPERNHQVSLMKQIYERAQQVHIVLGSGTADRTAIFDSARRLSTSIELQDLKRLGNAELRDLFICPWWTRLWVLQEVILAKIPVVHWGAESISFWALMEVMAAVRFAKIGSHSDDKKESRGGEQEQWLYNFDRAVYSFTVLRDPNTPPELVLSVSSNLEASDERDRVYGVLALMPALARIFPDYTLQARDIFQRTALEVMKQQQNLRLLRLIRTIEHSPPERRPSWVPSFGGLSGLIGEHIDVFGFTGNDVRVPFLLEETGTGGILVNAHVLEDSVKVVGPSCGLEYQRRNGCQSRQKDIQAHLRLTLRTWFELAAEEAKPHYICSNIDDCDSSVHSHRCVRTEFWKTILCDGLFDLVTGRELQNLSLTFKAYDGWLQAGGRDTRLSPYQHGELRLLAGSSTFFITKRGRMGLSRSNVQNGDVIALFAGETIPYILRPHSGTESKRYNIAGSCFCNGESRCVWT
jgi:hypothetical protein